LIHRFNPALRQSIDSRIDSYGEPYFLHMLALLSDEREMLKLCVSEGIGTTPWSPLARGRLARPWTGIDQAPTERSKTDAFGRSLYAKSADVDRPVVERVHELAAERGVPAAQIAMAWLLRQPAVTSPIVGATKPHHLDDAIAAASLTLSDDEAKRLEELYQPHGPTEAYS